MASHNRTPTSVLDAPVSVSVYLEQFTGNRARARAAARRERLARPKRLPAPRIRPDRTITAEAWKARDLRRSEARARRLERFGRLS